MTIPVDTAHPCLGAEGKKDSTFRSTDITESVDEAVEFAKGCPVLQGDGNSVEVRKIAKGDGMH